MSTGISSSCARRTPSRSAVGDELPPPGRALGRIGARAGIEQRQPLHPLRRLAHDLVGDVAAHGEAGEGEARRRRGQDRAGDAGHGVVAGVIGNRAVGDVGEGGDLRRPQRRRAQEARHQHQVGLRRSCRSSSGYRSRVLIRGTARRASGSRQRPQPSAMPRPAHDHARQAGIMPRDAASQHSPPSHRRSLQFHGERCHVAGVTGAGDRFLYPFPQSASFPVRPFVGQVPLRSPMPITTLPWQGLRARRRLTRDGESFFCKLPPSLSLGSAQKCRPPSRLPATPRLPPSNPRPSRSP